MSYYYILPKKNTINFEISPQYSRQPISHIISHSLVYYLNESSTQIQKMFGLNSIEDIQKMINTYEYIFSIVPSSKLSVSKLKPFSNTFYILMEINSMFHLLDTFSDLKNIKILTSGNNSDAVVEYVNMYREDKTDISMLLYMDINTIKTNGINIDSDLTFHLYSFHFMFFELDTYDDTNNNVIGMITILTKILLYQNSNGTTVIRVDDLLHKPILDVLYLLSAMYEKVYVTKPNVTNIINGERYIVCKNFTLDAVRVKHYQKYIEILSKIRFGDTYISSLLKNDLPYFFINKIEESNIIIGQQQLEHMDNIINILKNKNREDKIETMKKNNIQKCIQWCEKHKIPFNKFTDKVNIFQSILHIKPTCEEEVAVSEDILVSVV
jgi:hypothetical protein